MNATVKPQRRSNFDKNPDLCVDEASMHVVATVIYAILWIRRAQGQPAEQTVRADEVQLFCAWLPATGAVATIDAALAMMALDPRYRLRMHCAGRGGGRWIVEVDG